MEFKPGTMYATTEPQSKECPYCGEIGSRVLHCRFIRCPFDKNLTLSTVAIRECRSCRREWLVNVLNGSVVAAVYLSGEEVE